MDPSEISLIVPIMAHHRVLCLELHLRSTDVGPTNREFLRPY